MTNNKVFKVFLLIIVLLFIGSILFYNTIQKPLWNAQEKTIQIAKQEGNLSQVTSTAIFNGDAPLTIVFGIDQDGKKIILWLKNNHIIHTELASNGYNEHHIEQTLRLRMKDADVKIIHIIPGIWQSEYVWEVYYENKSQKKYYYDYYRFSDGKHMITMNVSLD